MGLMCRLTDLTHEIREGEDCGKDFQDIVLEGWGLLMSGILVV